MRNFYPNTADSMYMVETNVFRDHISSGGCYISVILQGSMVMIQRSHRTGGILKYYSKVQNNIMTIYI